MALANTEHRAGAVGREGLVPFIPALTSELFTSVSVGSSPRYYLFTSATGRISVHTAPKYGTKPIRYVTLHFLDRTVTEIAPPQPFLSVNRRPIRYDFRGGATATLYVVNKALVCLIVSIFSVFVRREQLVFRLRNSFAD